MAVLIASATLLLGIAPATVAAPHAAAQRQPATFKRFFADFRAAVLAGDRDKVADMVKLPFKDFSGGEVDRSAATRGEFLAHYDQIFTPTVIAGIRASKVRGFKPGSDDGEAPGPIAAGEYLLDLPEFGDQLVFSPRAGGYALSRTPFYS